MGCDEQSTDPKKNETTSEIIFTPMKPPDFDKKDVKIVNLPPVFSRPADSTNDPHCMQFRIPDEYFEEGVDIQGNADPVLARVTVTVFLSFPRYTIAVFDRGMDCDRDDTATV
uniref:Uncharacterized protein n=1 Tax=Magallana gigas TaxID=29159 RepID=K1QSV5_MAGGI